MQISRSLKAKANEFSGGMKPTAGDPVNIGAIVGCDTESEVTRRTFWGEMKPDSSVGGRTDTAHNPTAYEGGPARRGLPGLWSGTPRL
ncbi:MAG: hypothetical protein ACQET5_08460 [Halobacteriota archaeon]|uniref:hypothetical protein n=1 Tax=Natronomonas sp. TaxID=2184060 RepID=UPI003974917A